MSICNITIKIGNGQPRTFHSDEELDAFLKSQAPSLEKIYKLSDKNVDKIFSSSFAFAETIDETIDKMNEVSKVFNAAPKATIKTKPTKIAGKDLRTYLSEVRKIANEDLGEFDEAHEKVIGGISVTKLIENVGNKHNINKAKVTSVNAEYQVIFRRRLKNEGFTPEQIDEMWEQELFKNAMATTVGEDVHYILETKFRQIADPSIRIDFSKLVVLTESTYNKYKSVFDELVNNIVSRFPNAKFYPEFDIVSDRIPDSIKQALKQKFPKEDYNKVAGRIDLVVIDEDGKAHLFDWKTSSRRIGKWGEMDNVVLNKNGWWHSTKKLKSWDQLGCYGAMLEQYGIPVETLEVVPLFVEFEKKGDDYTGNLITFERDYIADESMSNQTNARPFTKKALRECEYIFGVTKPIVINELREIGNIIAKMFPGSNIVSNQREHSKKTVETLRKDKDFIKPITDGTNDYKDGYRFWFYQQGIPDTKPIKCKTEEDLNKALEKYINDLNNFLSNQMVNFAKDLGDVIHTQGEQESLDTWLAAFSDTSKTFLQNQFRKYYKNGWMLTINEELNNNGIFIFKKHDKVEIVTLSEKSLHHIFKINGNVNISAFKKRDDEPETDLINVLNTQYGNMLLMKIACLIAMNPELIADAQITNVKVINPWHKTVTEARSNKTFVHNWNLLAKNYGEDIPLLSDKKSTSLFMDDAAACLLEASEIILSQDPDLSGALLKASAESYNDELEILSLMRKVERVYGSTYSSPNTEAGYVYYQLQLALLHNMGFRVIEEPNVGDYFVGIMPNGNMIAPAAESKSANIRMLAKMFDSYRDVYTEKYTHVANRFMEHVNAVYEEWGFNRATDSAKKFWEKFFEHEDGDDEKPVDSRMMLKRPNNSMFKDKPKSRAFIDFVLENINTYRKGMENIDEAISTNEFYEMPLLEASFAQTITGNIKKNGVQGVLTGFWEGIKELGSAVENAARGTEEYKNQIDGDAYRDFTSLRQAYNRFLDMSSDERYKLISDSSKVWDTNIEHIFLQAMASVAVTEASKQYGVYFTAFKCAVEYLHKYCGVNIPNITKYIEKYVKNRVYLKNIREHSMNTAYSILKVAKQITSGVALKLNTRTMTREYLVSLYTAYSRTANHQLPGLTGKDFSNGLWYVINKVPVSLDSQNFVSALNRRYAMTMYSSTEMASTNKQAHWGFQNISSDDLYITSQLADNHFRMGVLIGKLMADGAFNAYSWDGPDLKYDWTLDKRFSVFAANDTSDMIKYAEQRAMLIRNMKEWANIHTELEYPNLDEITDDQLRKLKMPDAYTPSMKGSIRQMASSMFGYFDVEDKSLLVATLGGAAFMQYKTWLSAKLNQHLKQPGFVNIWQLIKVRDPESGEPLWLVYATGDELASGKPPVRRVKESDVQEEWMKEGRAIPWLVEEGTFQEGTIMAMGEFLHTILTWDGDEFRRNWENPIKRGRLIIGLLDSFGMMLLMGLITALYGEDTVNDMANQDWMTQWSYGVLMGFAEDGPIHKVIASTAGDLNPPSMVAIQKWAQTVNNVLAGNKSVARGLVESFGITREFKGYFE